MKTIISILAMLLIAAFAGNMEAEQINVRGYIIATETFNVVNDTLVVDATGRGNASFGPFTVTYHAVITIPEGVGTETYTFTVPNGDTLSAKGTGQGIDTGLPDYSYVAELLTVTGGTGQFAGATGNFSRNASSISKPAKRPAGLTGTLSDPPRRSSGISAPVA